MSGDALSELRRGGVKEIVVLNSCNIDTVLHVLKFGRVTNICPMLTALLSSEHFRRRQSTLFEAKPYSNQ